MELIVISDTRMKIMLSREDMQGYNIDISALDAENEASRQKLSYILDDASKNAGIKSLGRGAFVRVFASCDGGCEMFVTRFSELSDKEDSEEGYCVNMSNEKNTVKRRFVYCFFSMRELLCACRALFMRGYRERSDLYKSETGESFYLVLYEGEGDISVVLEYAEPVFFGGALVYISEHSIPVIENEAVQTLSALC